MKPIGVGVIGTGFMGKAHSIAYSASASVFGTGLRPKLEIVCDLSPDRASQRATDLGFLRHTDKWQDVVNDPKVELISVCTPNNTHSEIAISALKNGKHVWCEKPMSSSMEDSQKMAEESLNTNAKTIIGYNYIKTYGWFHQENEDLTTADMNGRIRRIPRAYLYKLFTKKDWVYNKSKRVDEWKDVKDTERIKRISEKSFVQHRDKKIQEYEKIIDRYYNGQIDRFMKSIEEDYARKINSINTTETL